jgi:hypothetical protein
MDVEVADDADGWQRWPKIAPLCSDNRVEIDAVEADRGRYLDYLRVVARRRSGARSKARSSRNSDLVKAPLLR